MSSALLSHALRHELSRVALRTSPYIVADMDSTLIKKARNVWGDLNASPAKPHLLQWLSTGGRLLIVTSDEGYRPFHQMLGQIPSDLRRNVVMCIGEGAVLYSHSASHDTFVEDHVYSHNNSPGLPFPEQAIPIACDLKRAFMCAAYEDRTLLHQCHPTSRKESYELLFEGVSDAEELTQLLTNDFLMHKGSLPGFGGSCLWSNASRIPKGWDNDTAKDTGKKRKGKTGKGGNKDLDDKQPRRWTTLWILGIGQALSERFIKEYRDRFTALGIHVSAAPNSIFLKNQICSKALPIEYMWNDLQHNSVAFGDNPKGNDFPMTLFDGCLETSCGGGAGDNPKGMPFVSVSAGVEDTPVGLRKYYVGGLETGTALCLKYMNDVRQGGAGGAKGEESQPKL